MKEGGSTPGKVQHEGRGEGKKDEEEKVGVNTLITFALCFSINHLYMQVCMMYCWDTSADLCDLPLHVSLQMSIKTIMCFFAEVSFQPDWDDKIFVEDTMIHKTYS